MENNLKIWIILAFTVASTCLARTPLDTLALERSDSGSRYVKVHGLTQRYLDQASQNYGIPWNSNISYGSVTDAKDEQVYRTVVIGTQTWMAQNLNYSGDDNLTGVCYTALDDMCNKYGRLYSWPEAMVGHEASSAIPSGVQGICPAGWHMPSDSEWTVMGLSVDPTNTVAGTLLKTRKGWNHSLITFGGGTDARGFRGLPGGYVYYDDKYYAAGVSGFWWSTTKNDTGAVWTRAMNNKLGTVIRSPANIKYASVRCIKD